MTQAPTWGRIPFELQERRQWLVAAPDSTGALKVPVTCDAEGRLFNASNKDPSQWLTFDQATFFAQTYGYGIGFVLTASDPFVCIDLDVKDAGNAPDKPELWTKPEDFNRFWLITQTFDTYTELSQSGKGLHIWCLGRSELGAKFGGVEVYSQERFIACTGRVVLDKPLVDRQNWIDILVAEIRAKQGVDQRAQELDEQDAVYTDDEILSRARGADNSDKYIDLFEGRWEKWLFPSQSEADLALMSMYTFYSRSNEQCRRLFRLSALGQREKAMKDDRYLDRTLSLIRGRQEQEDKASAQAIAQSKSYIEQLNNKKQIQDYAASLGPAGAGAPPVPPADAGPAQAAPAPLPGPSGAIGTSSLDWPPGFAGYLAAYVYRSAPRPVKEVAIIAALGWLAGVCGKMWNIPGSGLNIYLILVARSAVGKEAMHSGISSLISKLSEAVPSAGEFVDFSDFVSGPALVKACAENPSFVNVAGEWGRKLRRLSMEGERDGPMQQLRTVMTNLYQKSGPSSIVGGLSYSKKENNIASVSGVSYSMIGETTPGTLYDSLTESMMEDGFLSRFTMIEYMGERPPANKNPQKVPDQPLVDRCIDLVIQAKTHLQNRAQPVGVSRDADAAVIMDAFDLECDTEINKTTDESWRQMWNRAHLKMLRIAALLAVGDNSVNPVITGAHCRWALDLIRRDIAIMQRKFEDGEIGQGDSVRERKLGALIKEYITQEVPSGYHIPAGMRDVGIIPRSYLQIRTARLSVFNSHKLGSTKALDEALRSLVDSGYLQEVEKPKLLESYANGGRAFRIMRIPEYSHHQK